jgi:hypothetical protein
MTQRIIRTLDNKMLQDTTAGVLLSPFRPYLVEHNVFIEGRLAKNGPRPQEIEVLLEEDKIPAGLTDEALEQAFKSYKATFISAGGDAADIDFKDFVKDLSKFLPKAKNKNPLKEMFNKDETGKPETKSKDAK